MLSGLAAAGIDSVLKDDNYRVMAALRDNGEIQTRKITNYRDSLHDYSVRERYNKNKSESSSSGSLLAIGAILAVGVGVAMLSSNNDKKPNESNAIRSSQKSMQK